MAVAFCSRNRDMTNEFEIALNDMKKEINNARASTAAPDFLPRREVWDHVDYRSSRKSLVDTLLFG
jgi:hypothetical protein